MTGITDLSESLITTNIATTIHKIEIASMSIIANEILLGKTEKSEVTTEKSPNTFIIRMKKSLFVI